MNTILVLLSATIASAPAPNADDGWLAWQGCWRAEGDAAEWVTCIVPDKDGARLINVVSGAIQSETRIVADGRARDVTQEGCTGTQIARWSQDRQRVFLNADMICGEGIRRKVSGIMSMQSTMQWLSAESVTSGPKQTYTRTKRYIETAFDKMPESIKAPFATNRLAGETARYAASAAVDLEDITEATKTVSEEVVAEWVTAVNQGFDLTGKQLLAMANQGVPASVIDAVVAVSNPERFAVRTVAENDRDPRRGSRDPCFGYSDWYWPSMYSGYNFYRYGNYYGSYYRCGYGRPYYTPWGYDPWGWRGYGTTVIVVRGDDDGSTNYAPNARVTRKGYSSGRSNSGSDASPRPSSVGGTTSSGSSGSASSGGSSSSGSSSGRTAKPRDHK